ncbi:MAG: DUF3037 domain-containing protein [Bacteroidia bacterium]|jgi:hypothetical protein|nr:DUF3037 domain-containing protein [Bacteroidia bacterium]
MQEKLLYEYAVIRYVPRVEREEFLNVGIILFCKQQRSVKMRWHINKAKLQSLAPEADVSELEAYLHAFSATAHGDKSGGPMAQEDAASRFRWLTAVRSSALQTSRPHPGFCADTENAIERLMEELVL